MAGSPAKSLQKNISVLPDNHKRQFLSCKNRMFPKALCSYQNFHPNILGGILEHLYFVLFSFKQNLAPRIIRLHPTGQKN